MVVSPTRSFLPPSLLVRLASRHLENVRGNKLRTCQVDVLFSNWWSAARILLIILHEEHIQCFHALPWCVTVKWRRSNSAKVVARAKQKGCIFRRHTGRLRGINTACSATAEPRSLLSMEPLQCQRLQVVPHCQWQQPEAQPVAECYSATASGSSLLWRPSRAATGSTNTGQSDGVPRRYRRRRRI